MAIENELLDKLLADYKKPEDIIGENGLLKQLTKALLERAMNAELREHLGFAKHDPAGYKSGNSRNGTTKKTLKGDFGEMELETPRDRKGNFAPKIVAKGQTRFTGFDDKIISLYARGMTTREIEAHLQEIYGVDVSPGLISNVTEAVMDEVKIWQGRSLDEVYPILYIGRYDCPKNDLRAMVSTNMDALRVKIRDGGHVVNKAIYVAIGVNIEGKKEVLGLWTAQNEGAKFWLQILTEMQNRGVKDIFIACVDGLKGFPEAIEAVYPKAEVQLCIVHLVRASLNYVNWKQRKEVAADLKRIYQSSTVAQAEVQLEEFAAKWDEVYPMVSQIWRRNWARTIPFFAYPAEIRKAIYTGRYDCPKNDLRAMVSTNTTNAIESLNMSLRKIVKMRGSFPTDEAAMKLLYLALQNASKKWTMPIQHWSEALNRFAILWPERMPASERAA
jgi:putative transposase